MRGETSDGLTDEARTERRTSHEAFAGKPT